MRELLGYPALVGCRTAAGAVQPDPRLGVASAELTAVAVPATPPA